MKFLRATPAVLCIAFLGAAFAPSISADEHDKKTTFTFSGPVEIPPVYITGMRVLPAGTYVFKVVNSSSDRHIIQIFNKDETKIFATILAIPNYRLQGERQDRDYLQRGDRPRQTRIAASVVLSRRELRGEEFVYPKARAVELAKVSNLPVLTHVTELTVVEVEKPEAPQVIAQLQQAPVKAVQPTGEVVELAQVVQPPAARGCCRCPRSGAGCGEHAPRYG